MAKLTGLVWIGRVIVALFVGAVLLNMLSTNPRFEDDPLGLYGISAAATLLCIVILYILTKSGG